MSGVGLKGLVSIGDPGGVRGSAVGDFSVKIFGFRCQKKKIQLSKFVIFLRLFAIRFWVYFILMVIENFFLATSMKFSCLFVVIMVS